MPEKEYIEREAAIQAISNVCEDLNYSAVEEYSVRVGGMSDGMGTAIEIINDLPAADVREVVLCKDCKYCIKKDDFEYWCNGFCSPACLVRHDDFCSHGGEKR